MMWNCPKLVRYWGGGGDVRSLINSVFSVNVDTTPLTCILGYVEDVATNADEKLAIARMLFMTRKVIAYHWLDSAPPPPPPRRYCPAVPLSTYLISLLLNCRYKIHL